MASKQDEGAGSESLAGRIMEPGELVLGSDHPVVEVKLLWVQAHLADGVDRDPEDLHRAGAVATQMAFEGVDVL